MFSFDAAHRADRSDCASPPWSFSRAFSSNNASDAMLSPIDPRRGAAVGRLAKRRPQDYTGRKVLSSDEFSKKPVESMGRRLMQRIAAGLAGIAAVAMAAAVLSAQADDASLSPAQIALFQTEHLKDIAQ